MADAGLHKARDLLVSGGLLRFGRDIDRALNQRKFSTALDLAHGEEHGRCAANPNFRVAAAQGLCELLLASRPAACAAILKQEPHLGAAGAERREEG